jgi:medium-chain acyl-[acyl-carrier-protein] hydrolase
MLLKNDSSTNAWIACPKPNPTADLRLICFPYAGGGASAFSQWPKLLPPTVELWAVQLPGRETRLRERPYRQFPQLVEALAEALQPYLGDKPFALFGHSLGALICFETARFLCRQTAAQPVHLFVSGRRSPHLFDSAPPLHSLPDTLFIQRVQQRYNGIPAIILQDQELLDLFLPILRADFELLESYCYADEPPLNCPISAFGGYQDSQATELEVAGWRNQTRQAFTLTMLPGDHFFVQTARLQLIQAIVNSLNPLLGQLAGDSYGAACQSKFS